MWSDFRFANPHWVSAIWMVVAAVGLMLWLDQRRSGVLSRMISVTMQGRLVRRPPIARRWAGIGCLGLAGISLVIALMRPQWGLTYVKTPRVGAQIMVCLDVSKSMLAEDTAPNRLDRAKAEVTDLLTYLDGDQVGLIAFAGQATVLCPLTPDFSFFKLILDGAGPDSVQRGGTRLEEPIRKAIDGFRSESDVSRLLVLITDGEDHDSHPVDAAKAAAERGIKILAIGLGDEAGSEIRITDRRTGVQQTVHDANGNVVVTRLDGQTLRDMALATEGAYIPAGTGVLNLQSIFDAHIAPLVRGQLDDRGRAVRNEAFQWGVLAALIFLFAGVTLAGGSVATVAAADNQRRSTRKNVIAAIALAVAGLFIPVRAHADEEASGPAVAAQANATDEAHPKASSTGRASTATDAGAALEDRDPRSLYNEGITHLADDFDQAERLLVAARRAAGIDGEVRFRATYNIGWVEIGRADALLKDKPAEALSHLESAADWFRMAIGLREDDTQSRHNLEVVLRRILELRDSLATKDDRDVTQRLDALIETQRAVVGSSRSLVDRVTAIDDPNATETFRPEFRQLAVQQREVLSDSQSLAETVGEELDVIDGKPEEERTDEEQLRAAQLHNVLHYSNRANQRIGGARSQMRLRQAQRAFRRAAAALEELKRARDQLRGPVEVLDQILADAVTTAQLTALQRDSTSSIAAEGKPDDNGTTSTQSDTQSEQSKQPKQPKQPKQSELPAWLNQEFLLESQQVVSERTGELRARLQAGSEQEVRGEPDPSSEDGQQNAAFLEMLREALPSLSAGDQAMQRAVDGLNIPDYLEASNQQRTGIDQLSEAREHFLDVRGLIELVYATQTQITAALDPEAVTPDQPQQNGTAMALTDDQVAQRRELVKPLQIRNRERMDRLSKLIDKQRQALPADGAVADGASAPPADDTSDVASELQRLDLAIEIADTVKTEMTAVVETLAKTSAIKTELADATDDADDDASESDGAPSDAVEDKKGDDTKAEDKKAEAVVSDKPFAQPGLHSRAAVEKLEAQIGRAHV